MKPKQLIATLLACCIYLFAPAQTTPPNCNANFSYNITDYKKVNFTAQDSLGALHYWWFGDGTAVYTEQQGRAIHVYNNPGTYEVKHIIVRGNCKDTVVKQITLQDYCKAQYWGRDVQDSITQSPYGVQYYNTSQSFTEITAYKWSFGDGSFSNEKNPTHFFPGPGNYLVTLKIKTRSGCQSELSYTETINPVTCNFQVGIIKEEQFPNPYKYLFQPKIIGLPFYITPSYFWSFGDGSSSVDKTPKHTYQSAGTYNVCLKVKLGDTCIKETCQTITITDNCQTGQVEFLMLNDSVGNNCLKKFFKDYTYIGQNTTNKYKWSFGDGTSSTDKNPMHIYSLPGKYVVCLEVEFGPNCKKSNCDTIEVSCDTCNITPKFEVVRDAANPLTLKFVNQTIVPGSGAQYKWSFGDGTTSADKDPVHTYTAAGTYNVCLKVYVNNTCVKEKCTTVVAEGNTCTIAAKFEWHKDATNCKNILFKNLSTVISPNVQFIWKFGDGSSSTATNPNHVYNQPGKYYVCLVAEAGPNCRKEYCDTIIVRCDSVPPPPTCDVRAKYTWKKDAQQWNLVHFANTSEPVSRIWKTRWWYGDGTESADFNSFHKYEKPGVYLVCLGVTSLNGCISYYCDSVRVIAPDTCSGKANFTVSRTPNSALVLKFEASYRSSTARYYWSFGDGSAGTGAVTTHYYQKAGKYKVCLTVKEGNCSTTTCKEIQAGANCDSVYVKYEYKRSATRPNQLSFTGITNDLPFTTQVWTIYKITPNGVVTPPIAILNQLNPTYLFTDTGSYKVCLKAVTGSKCVKEYCQTIRIEKLGPNLPTIITAFPNPAVNSIVLELTLTKAETVSFIITDAAGGIKAQYTKNGVVGNNRFTLPVEQLSQGYYMVEIKTATRRWTSKFQKG